MGLRIVYGRAGTGKSSICYQEIKKQINREEKIYIITPEQFSFTAEKKLMEVLPQNAVISAEVLTFQRMAYRVMQEVGGGAKLAVSSFGKAMLLYYLLEENKKQLTFLGKSDKNVELIGTTITELKKHNISEEQWKQSMEQVEDPYLRYKIKDISLLYDGFQAKMKEKYMDENDPLTILAEQLPQTNMFSNAILYIDEFVGFTPQEYSIIEILLKQAKEVIVTICADKLESQEEYVPETDLFYFNRRTMNQIIDIAAKHNVKREEDIYCKERYRYQAKELQHLETYLYENRYHTYQEEPEHIHLFLADNPYSEIENVAKQIVTLVRDKKYRYKDIGIITKEMGIYSSLAKAIFSAYEIPVFIDEKKELSGNLLVKYLLAMLEVFSQNWSHESMFHFIKNGFSDIKKQECFLLEKYCVKWGITRNKWYQSDWHYDEAEESMNQLRRKVVEPLLAFKEKLSKRKTVGQMTKALYAFLEENGIHRKLEDKIRKLEEQGNIELAQEYETSWKVVLQVLDELVLLLKEETISFDRYIQILKIGLGESKLGAIPATLDQVMMGDVDRSRSHKVKAVFVIGLNDGVFPSIHRQEGFLDDENREKLKQLGLELAKGSKEKQYEDNGNIYKALTTAEEELFLSYSSSDLEGGALRASTLISKIKKLYPKLKQNSDGLEETQDIYTRQVTFEELLTNIKRWQEGEELSEQWKYLCSFYGKEPDWKIKLNQALEGMNYTNLPKPIHVQNIQKLYGDILKTSVSRLEQYRRCPFSFYLAYGLGIKEEETFTIESMDTGSFMHEVIDCFFEWVQEKEVTLKELSEEELQSILDHIIEERLLLQKNAIFTSSEKYKILVNRLKRLLKKSMKYMIQTITSSEFEVFGHEVEFKTNGQYPPIRLSLEDGRNIEIIGKIDRVDIGKSQDKTYFRIIDYKSSIKNIDLNEVEAGLQIQLLTYLDAMTKVEDMIPAGVLYFHLIDPIVKANKNMSEEDIEQEIKKKFKMQGLVLADVNVVKMMDQNLEKGASNVIPAYLDKEGNLNKHRSSVITQEQFQDLQRYIHITIQQIAKEMLSGRIDVKPYYSDKKKQTPCQFCQYHAICQFDTTCPGNEYQFIPNQDKEIVFERMKKKD